jgi:ribosomal protein S18 acetylase RimI-like enzyme
MMQLFNTGFAAITLTVTEANRQAVELYAASEFRVRYRFDAMVLDRNTSDSSASGLWSPLKMTR